MNVDLIKKLSDARGVSGFEDEVINVVKAELANFCTFEEDSMRNLYIYPNYNVGNRPLLMLDAHSDEVGFMVQAIKPDGTLRFVPIGGWNEKSLPSSKVQVKTSDGGYVKGIIAAIPPHFTSPEQRNAPVTIESLSIDVGATSKRDAEENFGIKIGAPVIPYSPFEYDEKRGLMFGKAFDDRLGVYGVIEAIKILKNKALNVDIVGVISSQEEVGERGITAVCSKIKPDAAICFEGGPADDTFTPDYLIQDAIRGGCMVRYMDRTVICTPRFVSFTEQVAAEKGVKVQMAVRSGGGNNGAYIISSNGGTPVIVACTPVRYIHSFNCIAAAEDVNSMIDLGVAVAEKLNGEIIKGF